MLLGKGKGNGNHVRGLEHLELLQSMASKGPLTEFCLAGVHLGDADDMVRSLSCCIQKHKYDLRGGVINRPLLARMEQVESTLTSQILGQSPTGVFRDAAFEINSRLLDHPGLLPSPGDIDGVLAQLVDHPGLLPSPGDIDGVLAQLVPLIDDLEQKVILISDATSESTI
ncbi:hypothetical protein D1007_61350 [Hordeum vulgare]|nr:hypothetical protein D1007_61350 [Hordeum vulgare]